MDARQRMLKFNQSLGTSALDGAQALSQARDAAEATLRSARQSLERFGSPTRFMDHVQAKMPTDVEKRGAVNLAKAAKTVEEKTAQLEATLRDHSVAVLQIEKHQLELVEAQKALATALEQREQSQSRVSHDSPVEDRTQHLAAFKAAVRGGRR